MTVQMAPAPGPLRNFGTWWLGELSSLVPGRFRAGAQPSRQGLAVCIENGGLALLDRNGRRIAGPSSGDQSLNSSDRVIDALVRNAKSRSPEPVSLRLPFAACFERKLDLPSTARGDIGRILELELERATPFRLKDVYTAFHVNGRNAQTGNLDVRQLVVKRSTVDDATAELTAAGVEISRVDCWAADGSGPLPVDFLDRRSAGGAEPAGGTRLAKVMAGAALVLALSAAGIAIARHEGALEQLEQETANIRARAEAVRQGLDRSQSAQSEIDAVNSLKSAAPPVVRILDELTRILPDTAWLTDLRIDADKIDIAGLAKPAAALIPAFEHSAFFTDAALTAPVTLDSSENKERFSLRVRVRNTIAVDAPASTPETP